MKIKITVIRRTWYASTVEMTEEEFNRLSEQLDGNRDDRKRAEQDIGALVKPTADNWQDDEVTEIPEFEEAEEEEAP